jgi:hypothetical protein
MQRFMQSKAEENERKIKQEQDLLYKRATERLHALEQMEQERKKRFQLEMEKLQ